MRIFATSDLHTDFRDNWLLLKGLSSTLYQNDVLIVAGDIGHNIDLIKNTLELLRAKFKFLFYVPGNHELWIRGEGHHSLDKFFTIIELCKHIDVNTSPLELENFVIIPLFSWYEKEFDIDEDPNLDRLDSWSDFYFCKWPENINSIANYFLSLNQKYIKPYSKKVISFSHFLPRRELLPSREWLRFKALPQVAGSIHLDKQIRAVNSTIHIFGHSHMNWDVTIKGIRYIQNALSYPRERINREKPTIKLIWSDEIEG
ncbi:MAG: metallophosphoesterase [Acidobacteria bacterium]|nr:metallophosphoesterase [Acidobacteriota bacterium]